MPLTKLTEHVYLVPGRTNTGVIILDNNECVVIDTGIDEDSGRRILNAVKPMNLRVRAIINTHHHADHIGGNAIIVKRTNARVYATPEDKPFIERPVLEPLYLYGSFPPKILRTKLLEAEGVPVGDLGELRGEVGFDIVPLPGHSMGMVGIAYEGVLFTADAFFPIDVIRKYGAPYHLDVRGALNSLGKLRDIVNSCSHVVPAHGDMTNPQQALTVINENINAINRLRDLIISNVPDEPIRLDELIRRVFTGASMEVDSPHNYFLNRSAILSYVTWLMDEGLLELRMVNNEPVISKIRR